MASTHSPSSVTSSDSSHVDQHRDAIDLVSEPEESPKPQDIVYVVHWESPRTKGVYECEDDPCPTTKAYRPPQKRPQCVMSVSIRALVLSTEHEYTDSELAIFQDRRDGQVDLASRVYLHRIDPDELRHPDDDFKTTSISAHAVQLRSPHLLQAVRDLVKYYPSQPMGGGIINVMRPYSMLLHYYHDFKNLRDTYAKNNERTQTGAEITHDLTVLIDWLEPHYIKTCQEEEERHRRGVATRNGLWLLYRPGCIVYSENHGIWHAYVVKEIGNTFINVWYLEYDGKEYVRKIKAFYLDGFVGEREITSLGIIPRQYVESMDKRQALLESRGHRYEVIMRNMPCHLRYSGDAITQTGFKLDYEGEIIVDSDSWDTHFNQSQARYRRRDISNLDSGSDAESILGDEATNDLDENIDSSSSSGKCYQTNPYDPIADWKRFKGSQVRGDAAELSAYQKSLLPTRLRGFALRNKLWMTFELESTHSIVRGDKDSALKNLIIPDEDRQIITAMTQKHMDSKGNPLFSDFINGKGEGLILLLHGPPGTGKTFTVECIAEYTRRPLLSLTVADIGTKEDQMETQLSHWFEMATKWEAILLIDEADVFLEKRRLSDLARNSLVSVFLRSMEYYNGMLFLTTNRVGHLDDGFLSRIQVAIAYKKLSSESQRQIWLRFFRKVNEEDRDLSVSWEAQQYIKEEGTAESMDMNGREIRSALQTAVALANNRAVTKRKQSVEVSIDDIKQVASRRRRFIEYIDGIRRASEQERALDRGDRNDE